VAQCALPARRRAAPIVRERRTTTPPGQRLLMAAAVIVATAAGIVGAIMLIAPSSTGRYFAWPLGPRALAALVGGFYVVSAPVFAYAGRRSAVEVRGLAAAVLAFTLPTLAATYLHRDVFDFDRLFAMAWVVLCIATGWRCGSGSASAGRSHSGWRPSARVSSPRGSRSSPSCCVAGGAATPARRGGCRSWL
jgi:hypothetical protein